MCDRNYSIEFDNFSLKNGAHFVLNIRIAHISFEIIAHM